MTKKSKIIRSIFAVILVIIIAVSGYKIWEINDNYIKEAEMHELLLKYKPEESTDGEIVNQSIIDLQSQNNDVVGWITIPHTGVDYPFVQSGDNDYYLRRDLYREYARAGTIFMDYRCDKEFSSQNTILYGHNMKNESMFGTFENFASPVFFAANKTGTIYLPFQTLTLEFFAYMVVKSNDEVIYITEPGNNYLDYVKDNAKHYRNIEITAGSRIVTLSTCSYEFDNARMVLIAKIV